jgi:hypothetical protein
VASLKYQTTLNLRAAADVDPVSNLSEPTCCGSEALDSARVKVNAVKAISPSFRFREWIHCTSYICYFVATLISP